MLIPVSIPSKKIEDEFKLIFEELLEEVGEIPFVDEESVLCTIENSSSVMIENNQEIKRGPVWKLQNSLSNPFELSTKLIGKRCCLSVSPANCRDTIILDIRSRNTISLVSNKLRPIVKKLPFSTMCLDEGQKKKVISDFVLDNTLFTVEI